MGCGASTPVRCPKCDYKFIDGEDFLYHLERCHNLREYDTSSIQMMKKISCPKCTNKGLKDEAALVEHLEKQHTFLPGQSNTLKVSCPRCDGIYFDNSSQLFVHFESKHHMKILQSVSSNQNHVSRQKPQSLTEIPGNNNPEIVTPSNINLPKVGDKVLAMWSKTKWQYFDATIRRFNSDDLTYEIEWDDQDPTGRVVDYYNLALNQVPDLRDIGVGSIVLFHQGAYKGQAGIRLGGVRWHQGKITRVYKDSDGKALFDGCHTKGHSDGKWVTYKGYSHTFTGYNIEDFRIGPNVFNLIESESGANNTVQESDVDIYFSYTPIDSPAAIKNREVSNIPEKYLSVVDNLCDPRDIADELKSKGLKVGLRSAATSKDLKKTAVLIKKAKVFIACISDQYVADDECQMEFQYAKTTLNTPIVPLVVGDGSFEWTFSVVGMLIAGELYIHFRDKTVESVKFSELFQALKSHFDKVKDVTDASEKTLHVEGPADIFVSYCWTNSYLAKEAKQIDSVIGNKFSDPRLVKNELERAGYSVWLDIERLRSANASAGMYEQLTAALKEAKVVLPFASSEYARSPNCRIEFQFAMKSLGKPVIPVVVGDGKEWETSVIGALVNSTNQEPISLQCITDRHEFDNKLKQIMDSVNGILGSEASPNVKRKKVKYRAPKIGDHVVCHHFHYAYYMATIDSFNSDTLEYTVNWDDGDSSGRVQPYDQIALDVVPDSDDVGTGSIVFFQQGRYSGTEGSNTGGQRYHQGVVTSSRRQGDVIMYSGHHTKGDADGKWITYKGYSYEFHDIPMNEIRIAPTAMDALLASKS